MLSILAAQRPVLTDGAMATNLFDAGLHPGEPAEIWNALRPEQVQALHRAFIEAGADILLTNSFGGHPERLRGHGLTDRTAELNRLAACNARAAAEAAGRPVMVGGAVGPTGASVTTAEHAAGFAAQMEALAAGGVDVLWIETMSYPEEMRMAAGAAARIGLPFVLTASFGRDGRTLGGLDAAHFAQLAVALPTKPAAIGANCGSGTAGLLRDVALMHRTAPDLPLVAKASAGLPEIRDGRFNYPLSDGDAATYVRGALDAGARIVGGCCGTTPAHVAAMRSAIH